MYRNSSPVGICLSVPAGTRRILAGIYKNKLIALCCYLCRVYNGFDDQERNLRFMKTNFQVLKLKSHACNFKRAFYPFHMV